MVDNWLNWNNVLMVVVLVLSCYSGIKVIDLLFSNKSKKKNSLF
jgi:hypothetical protein